MANWEQVVSGTLRQVTQSQGQWGQAFTPGTPALVRVDWPVPLPGWAADQLTADMRQKLGGAATVEHVDAVGIGPAVVFRATQITLPDATAAVVASSSLSDPAQYGVLLTSAGTGAVVPVVAPLVIALAVVLVVVSADFIGRALGIVKGGIADSILVRIWKAVSSLVSAGATAAQDTADWLDKFMKLLETDPLLVGAIALGAFVVLKEV